MKRKSNLSEELYKMRKLMNFDSEKFRDEKTSLDTLMEEKMVKKYLLSEQDNVSDPFAGDKDCDNNLINHPVYNAFKTYILKHQNKEDRVGDTIKYWSGGGSKTSTASTKAKTETEKILKNISTTIDNIKNRKWSGGWEVGGEGDKILYPINHKYVESKEYSINELVNVLNDLSNTLTKFSKEGVYLKRFKRDDEYNGLLKRLREGMFPGFGNISQENLDKVKKELKDKGNLISSGGFTIDCKVKYDLLTKIGEKKKVKELGIDKAIQKAKYIKVRPSSNADIKVTDEGVVETQKGTEVISYPPKDVVASEGGATLSKSMMVDDGYQLTQEAKEDLKNLLVDGINTITSKPNGQVLQIFYGSAASTSKVNTSFGGIDADGKVIEGKYNMENNIKLVDARTNSNSINEYLKTIIGESIESLPNKDEITIEPGDTKKKPNQGPFWEEDKPEGGAGKYKGGYGPLYKQQNKYDTPQKFYSPDRRNSNPEIKKEYDEVFGPYRFNGGFINIIGQWSETVEETDISVATSGKWNVSISWKTLPSPPPPRRKKGKGGMGGGQSWVGVVIKNDCPFW
jgi:hypothetical protein